MSKYEELIAARNKYADLFKQRARIVEKEDASCIESKKLSTELIEAEKAYTQCEKQHIRDKVSDEELAASKVKVGSLREKLSASNRLQELSTEALSDINAEIAAAGQRAQGRLIEYCYDAKESLSAVLNTDKKLRKKLLEIRSASVLSGGTSDWGRVLAAIFTPPDHAEILAEVDKFNQDHKLNE